MGELISLPFKEISNPALDIGSFKPDYPLTEISVHYGELKRLRAAVRGFFKNAHAIRKYNVSMYERSEIVKRVDLAQTELNKGPQTRHRFPFFIKKNELIDLERMIGAFERLSLPEDSVLDYFFNCLPNYYTGDGVYTVPIVYLREKTQKPMPILVADMELDLKDMPRAAVQQMDFEKTAAGYFQLALFYKILVEPEGLISINPVYDWEGTVFPGRQRLHNWLKNIVSAITRSDFARLWDLDTAPAVWHANDCVMVKFDVLEPNVGYFQHYCFLKSDEIVDFETLALVRIEPSIVF